MHKYVCYRDIAKHVYNRGKVLLGLICSDLHWKSDGNVLDSIIICSTSLVCLLVCLGINCCDVHTDQRTLHSE